MTRPLKGNVHVIGVFVFDENHNVVSGETFGEGHLTHMGLFTNHLTMSGTETSLTIKAATVRRVDYKPEILKLAVSLALIAVLAWLFYRYSGAQWGKLTEFLKAQGDESLLGGWIALLAPHAGPKVVADHKLWPYFARRFAIEVAGYMEPKPGVPPSTKHLRGLGAAVYRGHAAENVG